MDMVNLGKNMRKARKALGLTQAKVSEAIDKSNNYYSAIERGVKVPKLETFLKIAKVLQVTPNELLLEDFISKGETLKGQFLTGSLEGLTEAEFKVIYDMVIFLGEKLKKTREANHKELIMHESGYLLGITKGK